MQILKQILSTGILFAALPGLGPGSVAQTPPSDFDYSGYDRSFKAVYDGASKTVKQLLKDGFPANRRDARKRTAIHIAAFRSHDEILKLLVEAGGDINAFEYMRYDAITIAAVANDVGILKLALELGGNPGNVTSPYDGTALIAAAHLGHAEVVRILLEAGAPVDHVNNLGWTALLEAIILGDGSNDYVTTVEYLLAHDADPKLPDNEGITPLQHAKSRGYQEIADLLSE